MDKHVEDWWVKRKGLVYGVTPLGICHYVFVMAIYGSMIRELIINGASSNCYSNKKGKNHAKKTVLSFSALQTSTK